MRLLLLVSITFIFLGCSQQRRINYHFSRLEKLGVKFTDSSSTTVEKDTSTKKGESKGIGVSDSTIQAIKDSLSRHIDTKECDIDTFIKYVTKTVIVNLKVDTVFSEDSTHKLKIWLENGVIKYEQEIINTNTKTETRKGVDLPVIEKKTTLAERIITSINKILKTIFLIFLVILLIVMIMKFRR